MADKQTLIDITNRPWSYDDIEFWRNPEDGTQNAVIEFEGERTRVRASILIVNGDKVLLSHEKGEGSELSIPGGGLDKGETPVEAAVREAQEEVRFNVKNARETGYDYCETHTEVMPWVKKHIPEKKWWKNYYTCLIIAELASNYNGEIDEADIDESMDENKKWYKISDAVNLPTFKKQWKNALKMCGYYHGTDLDESKEINGLWGLFDEDLYPQAKVHFGTTYNWRLAIYMTPDGAWLDGSGLNFGSDGSSRAVDHREVSDLWDTSIDGTDAMIEFMREGNIRLKPEAPGFEMIEEPTEAQYKSLERLMSRYRTTYYIDIDDERGWSMKSMEVEPEYGHAKTTILELKNYFQARKASMTKESLTEDSRTALINKSQNQGHYKDKSKGKNRFERKRLSKIANTVKQYNKINMNTLFKEDELKVQVPVIGESDSYLVTMKINGVIAEIAKGIKNNRNILEYKTVIQALTKVFNNTDVYVNCTCPDHLYNFAHWNIMHRVSSEDTAHDPGPGKGIRNPKDDKGRGCKHTLLVLANGDWMLKVASVINNYIHYVDEHAHAAFLKIIFPKLYGFAAEEAAQHDLVPEDYDLKTDTHTLDMINDYGKNRGKYQKGSNKNPITGTGGRQKKAQPDQSEQPAENEE